MYSTCIYCNRALGSNEAIEVFPVGRRLAFDAAKGRLWVVCKGCDRWNLSPVEERWEAIEVCEREFRSTRVRVSTDQIGLARLRDGTDLIRIGAPQRPEFAAWRYGDRFGRRRRRQLLVTGAAVATLGTVWATYLVAASWLTVLSSVGQTGLWWNIATKGRPGRSVTKLRLPNGKTLYVTRATVDMSRFGPPADDGSLSLHVGHDNGSTLVHGPLAVRALERILPFINRFDGTVQHVHDAVRSIAEAGTSERFVRHVAHQPIDVDKPLTSRARATMVVQSVAGFHNYALRGGLSSLPPAQRLGLEMALHEEQERRAMEGELSLLADAWREADEIAGIADRLTINPVVESKLDDLRDIARRRTEP
jgi:hypothetical protein